MKNKNYQVNGILVFMSDFGLSERFVASMKGVALTVDDRLKIHDLTHTIEPFNIWEAAQTLAGTIAFWPPGTVFVSVVDPGVGTERKSVVVKTSSGHFVVTPDNGTLTHVATQHGIVEVREIDEAVNRRPGSGEFHTFHGRDVYAFTGARLASGKISFQEVGPRLANEVVKLELKQPRKINVNTIEGAVAKIEKPYGNIVTNIPKALFDEFKLNPDDPKSVEVKISYNNEIRFKEMIPYVKSFGYVQSGKPLLYVDSNQFMGLAINSSNFSEQFKVQAGMNWLIQFRKLK